MSTNGGYLCAAWPAKDDILTDEHQQNSDHAFFIKLTFLSTSRRTIKELFVPRHEDRRHLAMDEWNSVRHLLNEMDMPLNAFAEIMMQISVCAILMVNDPANVGRLVLPMEVFVSMEEEEVVEGAGDGGNTVEVVVENTKVCSVCLLEMEVGSVASQLPCMHEFHVNCIGIWFACNRSCPMCRRRLD
ncbi:uncharacterized protein [Rutidosis leptorrhynchoides]|uniref:uncharacterized protein n=1 Tax=Rutidosis leptorrhynchoides TaxID=125765 RepID=UPI003A99FB87